MATYTNVPPLTPSQDAMPADGVFPLIICTTRDRASKMLSVIHEGMRVFATRQYNDPDQADDTMEAVQDLLLALAYIDDPASSPCYPSNTCQAPYWHDDDVDTAAADCEHEDNEEPWYTNAADWVITSFLAATGRPGAAIAYKTAAPRVRLAFRGGPDGAIARILADDVLIGVVDTYVPGSRQVIQAIVDLDKARRDFGLPDIVKLVVAHGSAS